MAVDDALSDLGAALSAQPQQQSGISYSVAPTSGVDAALADLAKSPEELRAAIGTPAKPGGIVHNTGAGINDFLAGGLGAPADVATSTINQLGDVKRQLNAALPPSMQKYASQPGPAIENPVGGSESIKSAMGWVGADPRNVGVNNTADVVARNVGQNIGGMVAPYMAGRAMIANGLTAGIPGAVARLFGGPAPADAGIARTALGGAGNAAI